MGACQLLAGVNRAFDIGGPEVLSYAQMMRSYAAAANFRQLVVLPLPVLTPWLAAQWVNLVTPVHRSLDIPLAESLQHDCVASETDIANYLPEADCGLTPYTRTVELALHKIEADTVETS
ncbi:MULTISPECIES: hypothetical protein [Arthrobacter]|uniref:hypothetical protein n=1 Tax=Arthrobacter TaxID=1663 RepID=UPI000ADC9203|nr:MULTISPECIES: hypothetical protein [Arthrobacter]